MTSILDQFEKASKQVIVLNFKGRWIESVMTFSLYTNIQAGTTVFINTLLENERPMFAKQKVAFVPQYPVHHMCAQSGRVTLVLVNNNLLRIDTQFPDNINGMKTTFHDHATREHKCFFLVQSLISPNTLARATRFRDCLLTQVGATS